MSRSEPDPEPRGRAEGGTTVGVVDVGATSVHVLVARVSGTELAPLADASVFLGLGDLVAERRVLGPAKRRDLVDVLAGYAAIARGRGASSVTLAGTEPLRQAGDAARTVVEVGQAIGLALHVLEPEEEAVLTLLGVAGGRPPADGLAIVDIGGGSTEVIVVEGGVVRVTALPIGAATLDPAAPEAMRRVLETAPAWAARELVAVGGTASNLARLVASSEPGVLDRSAIAESLRLLAAEGPVATAARYGLRPARAALLPAGAAILSAVLERSGLDRVRVSEGGLREGLARATAREGHSWRDRLVDMVDTSRRGTPLS